MSLRAKSVIGALALGLSLVVSGCGFGTWDETQTGPMGPSVGSPMYGQAVARFSKMHAADPDDLSVLLGLARNLRYSGKPVRALEVLESGIDRFSDDSGFQAELGKVRLTLGDVSGAQTNLEQAVAANGDNWHAYGALGVVYDLTRDFDKARAAYEKALMLCGTSVSVRNNMAISAGLSGDPETALSMLYQLSVLAPAELIVIGNIEQFERLQRQCRNCSSEQYQKIASSLYAPGAGSISNEQTCDETKPVQEPVAQAFAEKNFVDVHVEFNFDSAGILPESRPVLDVLARTIEGADLKGYRFVLEGHTDARGTNAYNQALSEVRADAVKRYLVENHGIDPNRLDTIGYGEELLRDPANPDAAVNRRVRITRLGRAMGG